MPRRKLRGGINSVELGEVFESIADRLEIINPPSERLLRILEELKREVMLRLSPEQMARREELEYAFDMLSMNAYVEYDPAIGRERGRFMPNDVDMLRYALFRIDPPKPARSVSPKATFGGPTQSRFRKGGKKAKRGGANLTPNELYDEIGKYLVYVVGGSLGAAIGLTLTVPMVRDTVNAIREYLAQLAEIRELERQVAEQQMVNNPMRVPGAHV